MNKHHKLLIAWLIISGLIVFTAVRQIQVAAASQIQARQPLPPPAKTRHAIRPVLLPWSGDPVADYVARCAKGMTDREIRWVIEDFRNAGLDFDYRNPKTSVEELLTLRIAEHRWYHDALVDALRLGVEQSTQVRFELTNLFEKAKADLIKDRETLWLHDETDGTVPPFIEANEWMRTKDDPFNVGIRPSLQPWNLCKLTSTQEKLTWKRWYSETLEGPGHAWEDFGSLTDDAGDQSSGAPEFLLLSPEFSGSKHGASKMVYGRFLDAASIFPFLKHQELPTEINSFDVNDQNIVAKVRHLHPAQLKSLILFHPEVAREIQTALDSGTQ